jgi:di/tripeptidase
MVGIGQTLAATCTAGKCRTSRVMARGLRGTRLEDQSLLREETEDMPSGTEFIKHEFDEAIAIQQSIVESGKALSATHPVGEVKRQLKSDLRVDEQHLAKLQKFGKPYGAVGKREEVAEALGSLANETASKAGSEESEAYEAHAVLLNLKRKQQDSADAVIKIARDRKETELRDAALKMKKEIKASADELAKSLADFAVRIAAK